jgi:predicted protein tyrosine phosphatase
MKRVLFICGKARRRSPTAAHIFASGFGMETDAAGLSDDADMPLSVEEIGWATHIAVMEKSQLARLRRKYAKYIGGRRIVCLDIADTYEFMQPELVELLKARIGRVI